MCVRLEQLYWETDWNFCLNFNWRSLLEPLSRISNRDSLLENSTVDLNCGSQLWISTVDLIVNQLEETRLQSQSHSRIDLFIYSLVYLRFCLFLVTFEHFGTL